MDWDQAYSKYCDNIFRHLLFINQYLHRALNDRLQQSGYTGIKMAFIEVIPYMDKNGTRLTDLVAMHQLPKASLSRLINTVHQQGYIEKQVDPFDSRANILFISQHGIAMVKDASRITRQIAQELSQQVGSEALMEFSKAVEATFYALGLSFPPVRGYASSSKETHYFDQLQIQLNAIGKCIDLKMLQANRQAGFKDLQNTHRVVLGNIPNDGIRISEIAAKEGASKQSISDFSHQLMISKYIRRIPDEQDRRAHKLVFAARGKRMITQSMQTLSHIEQEVCDSIGKRAFAQMVEQGQRLWYLTGGQGPQDETDTHFSDLDESLQPWLRALLNTVRDEHTDKFRQVFIESEQGLVLRPEFLRYLQNQVI